MPRQRASCQPNGGKSTAIKLFLGLIEQSDGTAEVMGESAAGNLEVRSRAISLAAPVGPTL